MDPTPSKLTSLSYSAVHNDSLPKIFALVIGINKYSCFKDDELKAAVGDANKFETYLVHSLNVPPGNIRNLRDEDATRDNIVDAFNAICDNPNITKGDAAVVIYFAGHGSRVNKPEEWDDWVTANGQIEIMYPSDMGLTSTNGEVIEGIPDRTISSLLNRISDHKGNNITLILDCCSSGGLNHGHAASDPAATSYKSRQIHNAPPLTPNCDAGIISKDIRGIKVAGGFSGKHHASHVLLAACGSEQQAWEDPSTSSGLFTTSLLETLSTHNINDLTYTSLMHRLPMPKIKTPNPQTPHCEGRYVTRRLFNHRATGADRTFILGQRRMGVDGSYHYLLDAGAAHGITEGSLFGVHVSNLVSTIKHFNPSLGECVASEIGVVKSQLLPAGVPSFPDSPIFYCKLVRPGTQTMRVYCEDRKWLESVFPPTLRKDLSVFFANTPDTSYLQFHLSNSKVSFTRNDPLITPWIGSTIPRTVDQDKVDHLHDIVRRIVHFDHQLKRTSPHDFKHVWMELKTLEPRYSDHGITLTPVGPNLIEREPADIVVDEDARVGMTIHNRTDAPLYPYLFHFDATDFSIIEWYRPPLGAGQTTNVDAPLPPHGSLAIGYGNGGVSPWQFLLRDGQDVDVGFFKLFLTTSPTDFSSIPQESPFECTHSRKGHLNPAQLPDSERWGSILSTVVQLRY